MVALALMGDGTKVIKFVLTQKDIEYIRMKLGQF